MVKVPGKPAPNQYGFAPSKNRKADQAELFSALEAYEFDLVHVFSCGKMAVHGMQFANRFDLPLVLSISDFYEDAIPYLTNTKLLEPWAAFRQKARFRDIADYADMITSTNKKAGDYLASAGIKRKLSLIPIHADPERFSRQNADPDQVNAVKMKYHLTDKTVAVFAGRLLYEKGVDILLQRWASHLKLERGLRLLIVGTGPEKAALQQLSKSLNLDKQVIFTGEVMNKDMPAYYAASDLFVSASETPLMSMAVCEALLAGLPCIVSDKSRPAGQLEHGKNGFYFSSSNELTDYVAVIMLFIIALNLVFYEKSENQLALLRTTARGRRQLMASKSFVMIMAVILITLLLYGINAVISMCFYNPINLKSPLQSVYLYYGSPFKLSIGQFLACYFPVKIISFILLGLFFMLICAALDNIIFVFVASAVTVVIEAICYTTISGTSFLAFLKYINIMYGVRTCLLYTSPSPRD